MQQETSWVAMQLTVNQQHHSHQGGRGEQNEETSPVASRASESDKGAGKQGSRSSVCLRHRQAMPPLTSARARERERERERETDVADVSCGGSRSGHLDAIICGPTGPNSSLYGPTGPNSGLIEF